ncbi:MAG: hypothetical protein Q8L14_30350 [Myxococcales bacterium]|nr:hypothetical protein [Myxococcales bacterium]
MLEPAVKPPATLGMLSANPPHRSFFRERLQRLAGPRGLEDWLVEEANVRGHLGAVGTSVPEREPTPGLSDADLIVALLMPHSEVDGRLFKLVVRMLQRAHIDPTLLWFHARRERADRVLYWLLDLVPESERTQQLVAFIDACPTPPRGDVGAVLSPQWRAACRPVVLTGLQRLSVSCLGPVDLALTKMGRADDADLAVVAFLLKTRQLDPEALRRAIEVAVVPPEYAELFVVATPKVLTLLDGA